MMTDGNIFLPAAVLTFSCPGQTGVYSHLLLHALEFSCHPINTAPVKAPFCCRDCIQERRKKKKD